MKVRKLSVVGSNGEFTKPMHLHPTAAEWAVFIAGVMNKIARGEAPKFSIMRSGGGHGARFHLYLNGNPIYIHEQEQEQEQE